jgi:flavin-dependent dehydrogenase
MQRLKRALLDLKSSYGSRFKIRVSLDHYSSGRHEDERGPNTYQKTLSGLIWLGRNGFNVSVAGRTMWGEDQLAERSGYAALFAEHSVAIDARDQTRLILFPEMDARVAAALAARQTGLDVVLADRAQPPIDKACGEGLMPDALAALRQIGVDLGNAQGASFRGIRFLDDRLEAEASFPLGSFGLGIRRTELHRILVERAKEAGVITLWGREIEGLDPTGAIVGGRTIRSRWIVGADGFHSRVRQWAGLAPPAWNGARRIGLRQHYRIRPWTEFVEVYWRKDCQAYVTPVGADEVCVAVVSTKESRASDLADALPVLASHLNGAEITGPTRGAISMSARLRSAVSGQIALVGDASGSVDAITGEGLGLAFRQANYLAIALAAGDLRKYDTSHRRMGRMPRLIARTLLLLDGNNSLRRMAFRGLAAYPRIFSGLLAVHVGALRRLEATASVEQSSRSRASVDRREAGRLPQ